MKQSERVKKMRKEFMSLHKQGYTIPEIAEKEGLSPYTVYRYLGDIAAANGVTREDLLKTPHKQHIMQEKRNSSFCSKVNPERLKQDFDKVIGETNQLIGKLNSIVKFDEREDM